MPKKPVVRQDEEELPTPGPLPGQEKLPIANAAISDEEMFAEGEKDKLFDTDELVVPFLKILQPLTPNCVEGTAEYNPAARPGMFYNTATEVLYDGKAGIIVLPISHRKSFVEWVPRDDGGGIVKDWGESMDWLEVVEPGERLAYKPRTKDGNEIRKSMMHFAFIVDPVTGLFTPVVIDLAGTQVKRARQWASLMQNAVIPTPNGPRKAAYSYFTWRMTTELSSNKKGKWHLVKFSANVIDGKQVSVNDIPNGRAIWEAAKKFKNDLAAGTVKTAPMERDNDGGYDGEGQEGDEKPF